MAGYDPNTFTDTQSIRGNPGNDDLTLIEAIEGITEIPEAPKLSKANGPSLTPKQARIMYEAAKIAKENPGERAVNQYLNPPGTAPAPTGNPIGNPATEYPAYYGGPKQG